MNAYSHDLTTAIRAHAGLRAAYEARLPAARDAIEYWRTSKAPDVLALRRSLEPSRGLDAAREVVAHLSKNTTDVVVLGIGGLSLATQTLAQLAFWGTPAYAPREGKPRHHEASR